MSFCAAHCPASAIKRFCGTWNNGWVYVEDDSVVGMCSQLNITPDFEHTIFAIVCSPQVVHTGIPQMVTSCHEYTDDVGF